MADDALQGADMIWDSSYLTGVDIIDRQHREMFRQVEFLHNRSFASREKVAASFSLLEQYIGIHFRTEELLMRSCGYSRQAEHKERHDDFLSAFEELKREFEAGGSEFVNLMQITSDVLNWLHCHILCEDMDFTPCLAEAGRECSLVHAL